MSVLDELIKQAEDVADGGPVPPPVGKQYLACGNCGYTVDYTGGLPPADCPKCGVQPKWAGPESTPAAAKSAALKAKQAKPEPAKPEPAKPEPAKPEPAKPEPAKRRARRKAEPEPEAEPVQAKHEPADPRERRLVAIAALIERFRLTELEMVEVGEATVQTIGYTLWNDGLPTHYFMEPTDTPQSFKAEFRQAKARQAMLEMDVVRCSNVTPAELNEALFMGNLVANRNSGDGLIQVFPGARVRVGAKLSRRGTPVFYVLGVARPSNE